MPASFNICVCASGGGGNFQALIDNQQRFGYTVTKLITDRVCGAVQRAGEHHIPFAQLDGKAPGNAFFKAFEAEIPSDTDLIVLAGFMPIIPADICARWQRRIINTHPSLLPKYGGRGMYGVRVQEAVLANKDEFAGCTVHFVTKTIDGGEIILQKSLKVKPGESAWDLGGRIFQEEVKLLPQAVHLLMQNRK